MHSGQDIEFRDSLAQKDPSATSLFPLSFTHRYINLSKQFESKLEIFCPLTLYFAL